MSSVRFIVAGRVQGVGFRAATRRQAMALGLEGLARNLPDGCVEVIACGDEAALDRLESWLRHGPPLSRVDTVRREPADLPAPGGFTVA